MTTLIESSIESGPRIAHAESWTPQQVLTWAAESFGDRAAICSSFQAEGMVVLDMAQQLGLGLRVFTIDTGRLPDETLELIDRVRDHYGIEVEVYHPDQDALSQLTTSFGVNAFYKSVSLRMRCCEIRKVDPLDSVLLGLDAWITGIRREHTTSRSSAQRIEVDEAHGGIYQSQSPGGLDRGRRLGLREARRRPIQPSLRRGIHQHRVRALYPRHCPPEKTSRAGRWWWEQGVPKECGIHLGPGWRSAAAD